MKLFSLLSAAVFVSGCAAIPEQDVERPSQVVKDPAKIHRFFLDRIRDREEAVAAEVTTLRPHQQLYFGVRNRIAPDLTRRILLGFEQHEIRIAEDRSHAIARWCNPEFGISREFKIVSTLGGRVWQLEITREQIEELAQAGLAWFRKQREVADGRIYAYPPDWVPARVSPRCPCGR